MRIAKIHKFFMTLFAAITLAITPSISFAITTEECIANAGNDQNARNACFPFSMDISSAYVFTFTISAKGVFYVDCGVGLGNQMQGDTSGVSRTNIEGTTIWKVEQEVTGTRVHVCVFGGNHSATVRIAGAPILYDQDSTKASFAVHTSSKGILTKIYGSLGDVFPTLGSGANQQPSFYKSFRECGNLQGPLPEGLFSNIGGVGKDNMFNETFSLCTSLTGELPEDFFGNFTSVGTDMFLNMFAKSGNFGDGYFIHKETFAEELNGLDATNAMYGMFGGTAFTTSCPSGYMSWHPTPNDYTLAWDGKVACEPIPEFTVTTSATNLFKFSLSPNGTFDVDCGTGGVLTGDSTVSGSTITRNAAVSPGSLGVVYQCEYADSAPRTIKFTSTNVTRYWGSIPAIRFGKSGNTQDLTELLVTGIDGKLGGVFPTIGTSNTEIPVFKETFNGCSNLTGSIPNGLFDGVTSAPVSQMFYKTFYGCSGLTSNPNTIYAIPENLFGGIVGAPAAGMFSKTFYGCSGLTGEIPPGLFGGISGVVALGSFEETFRGCENITGTVPSSLFSGVQPNSNAQINAYGGVLGFGGAMQDIFYGTGLDTCCHEGGKVPISASNWTYFTGGVEYNDTMYYPWTVNASNELAVACEVGYTEGQCVVGTPCDFADNLRVGAYSFALKKRDSNPITAEKTLNVKEPGVGGTEICYVPFSSTAPASINNNGIQGVLTIKVNGTTYYAEPAN